MFVQFHNDRRMPHRELRRDPVGPTLGKQVGRSKAQLFYAELRRAVPGIAAASVVHRQLPRCCVVHSERSALGFRGPPAVAFVAFALPNNLVLGQGYEAGRARQALLLPAQEAVRVRCVRRNDRGTSSKGQSVRVGTVYRALPQAAACRYVIG